MAGAHRAPVVTANTAEQLSMAAELQEARREDLKASSPSSPAHADGVHRSCSRLRVDREAAALRSQLAMGACQQARCSGCRRPPSATPDMARRREEKPAREIIQRRLPSHLSRTRRFGGWARKRGRRGDAERVGEVRGQPGASGCAEDERVHARSSEQAPRQQVRRARGGGLDPPWWEASRSVVPSRPGAQRPGVAHARGGGRVRSTRSSR